MGSDLDIVPSTHGHAVLLANHIRAADEREVRAAMGMTPMAALLDALNHSTFSRTAFFRHELACMWGLVPLAPWGRETVAAVWMLGTNAVKAHAKTFWQRLPEQLADLFVRADVLVNYVDERNEVALRWGRRLGFQFYDPAPYGVENRPFRFFTFRKEDARCALP